MEELISKKELLQLMNISYGQLYRWKRMNIIPEEWFIKKSSPTGQETYFDKQKIIERINFILSKKDNVSLEDIAMLINEKIDADSFKVADINDQLVSEYAKQIFSTNFNHKSIGNKELLIMILIEKYLIKSIISYEEVKQIASVLDEHFEHLYQKKGSILLVRKFGVSFILMLTDNVEVILEKASVKIIEVDIVHEINTLKSKMK